MLSIISTVCLEGAVRLKVTFVQNHAVPFHSMQRAGVTSVLFDPVFPCDCVIGGDDNFELSNVGQMLFPPTSMIFH